MLNFNKKIIAKEFKKFLKIYKYRPIKNNKNGMKINHMFAFFFLLKKLKPKYVIESGILRGQGTWLIEKTLPNTKIYSIDLDLSTRKFISKKVKYLDQDFKYFSDKIQPEKTLVFFDDHTCHYERLKQCKFLNIKQIIFEDNYNVGDGDFNSLKHILNRKNFIHKTNFLTHLKTLAIFSIEIFKKIFFSNYTFKIDRVNFRLRDRINKNNKFLLKNIKYMLVFPKILSLINDKKIRDEVKKNYPDEIKSYNSFTYIQLR
tara:strand:+ start:533 stop:1309 length:777 start_codon:yes stop_codon:yes gene_type:complete